MNRHRFDPVSFIAGVVFVVHATLAAFDLRLAVGWSRLWPLAAVVMAAALVWSAVRSSTE